VLIFKHGIGQLIFISTIAKTPQRMEKVGRCRDRKFDRTATLIKLRHRRSAKWKGRLAEREMRRRVDKRRNCSGMGAQHKSSGQATARVLRFPLPSPSAASGSK